MKDWENKRINMQNLPYRKGANAIVVDESNNFLIVQKTPYNENELLIFAGQWENAQKVLGDAGLDFD